MRTMAVDCNTNTIDTSKHTPPHPNCPSLSPSPHVRRASRCRQRWCVRCGSGRRQPSGSGKLQRSPSTGEAAAVAWPLCVRLCGMGEGGSPDASTCTRHNLHRVLQPLQVLPILVGSTVDHSFLTLLLCVDGGQRKRSPSRSSRRSSSSRSSSSRMAAVRTRRTRQHGGERWLSGGSSGSPVACDRPSLGPSTLTDLQL